MPMVTYSYSLQTGYIHISATPEYLDYESSALEGKYVWAYHIKIQNRGIEAIQLISRYWHICDGNGMVQEVRGHGVVGLQPVIEPNETFQYSSSVVLNTPTGLMHGSYEFKTSENLLIRASIPVFSLDSTEQVLMPN